VQIYMETAPASIAALPGGYPVSRVLPLTTLAIGAPAEWTWRALLAYAAHTTEILLCGQPESVLASGRRHARRVGQMPAVEYYLADGPLAGLTITIRV
jgi:hypothetical protein